MRLLVPNSVKNANFDLFFSFVQARAMSIYEQKIFGFLISDESVMSYPDYAERTFFLRVTEVEVPITEFSKFFNKNFTKYLSNMYLLYGKRFE